MDRNKVLLTVGLMGFIFSSVLTTLYWNEQPILAQAKRQKKNNVGSAECVNMFDSNSKKYYRKISLATIEATSQGFNMRIVDDVTETNLPLNKNLVLIRSSSNLHPNNYDGESLKIQRNGSFNHSIWVSSRGLCTYKGTVTFLNGADKKLFGNQHRSKK